MRQKILLPALLAFIVSTGFTGTNPCYNPFSKLFYDRAIAYDYEPVHETPFVSKSGLFSGKILSKKDLTVKQVKDITHTFCDTASYGNESAACFDPHFAIVFWKDRSVIASVEVCLECNTLQSTLDIPAQTYYHIEIPEDSLTIPRSGFSKQARTKINDLVKELGFTHTILPGSIFDE